MLSTSTYSLISGDISLCGEEEGTEAGILYTDSNRNWKGKYFFVKGMNWVCHQEEGKTMPHGYFDNTWLLSRI